jgi:cytochrome c biogenesis protein CcmG, thiol:disulfide interchange protein DsbE
MPASAKTRPPAGRTHPLRPPPRRQPPWLWIGLGAVVVIALIVAVVASRGSESSKKTPAGVQQTRPVTVNGTPLPRFVAPPGATGQVTPELHGKSFGGAPVNVTHDGRPKVVLFVAHWCPHCQKEVPLIADYLQSNPLPAGVDLITVATSTSPDQPNYPPSAWLQSEGWKTPVMADSKDGAAGQAFGLSAFPYFVAVDASGKVVSQKTGEITTDEFSQLTRQAMGQ